MEWKGRRESSNVEDRRGRRSRGVVGGGGAALIILLIYSLLSGNLGMLFNGLPDVLGGGGTTVSQPTSAQEEEMARFVRVVLADTETVWTDVFEKKGLTYEAPTMVLFSGSVDSACGTAESATGPFYCPGDRKLYIDLSFYQMMKERFRASGDFAMAYVVAHEVGHHVQTLLGISDKVNELRYRLSEEEFNKVSVRMELQADYFAGVFARYEQEWGYLEKGDIEEALNAANAIGDDTLQKQAQGYIVPDSFTHGTSEQRVRWFALGYKNGTIEGGDTFSARQL